MVLRPMNCPHHIQIYRHEQRSYRELPLRLAEFGTMWRYEKSGELSGLSRVRRHGPQRRPHLLHARSRSRTRSWAWSSSIEHIYNVLGITRSLVPALAVGPERQREVRRQPGDVGARRALPARMRWRASGWSTWRRPARRRFYGPKIDIQLRDPLGHSETISTIQVDFHLPEPVPARVRGRGRQVPPAGDGASRRDRDAGADDRVPDRAVRRGVPALAGAGPGGGDPDCRPAPGVRRAGGRRAAGLRHPGRGGQPAASGCRTRSARPSCSRSRTSW